MVVEAVDTVEQVEQANLGVMERQEPRGDQVVEAVTVVPVLVLVLVTRIRLDLVVETEKKALVA